MNAEFTRCCDFLAKMIEKYGPDISLNNVVPKSNISDIDTIRKCQRKTDNRILSYIDSMVEYFCLIA